LFYKKEEFSMNGKKLYKSSTDGKICGVCGGIAEYFAIDSTLVRLALIVFCCLGGSGVLAYIVAALVMPDEPTVIN
jgi:phage shock protein C